MIDVSSQTRSTRPVKDTLAICLPSGHFYIHYDTSGVNSTFVFQDVFKQQGGTGMCGGCGAATGPGYGH